MHGPKVRNPTQGTCFFYGVDHEIRDKVWPCYACVEVAKVRGMNTLSSIHRLMTAWKILVPGSSSKTKQAAS